MRTLSLREFQQRGVASLPPVEPGDPLLLAGRHAQFFLAHQMTMADIENEIRVARAERRSRKSAR